MQRNQRYCRGVLSLSSLTSGPVTLITCVVHMTQPLLDLDDKGFSSATEVGMDAQTRVSVTERRLITHRFLTRSCATSLSVGTLMQSAYAVSVMLASA